MQWTCGPDWTQHHNRPNSLSAMVSARGRLYCINNDAPPSTDGLPDHWSLIARDAFNGVMLWDRPIARWGWEAWSDKPVAGHGRFTQPPHIARTLVAEVVCCWPYPQLTARLWQKLPLESPPVLDGMSAAGGRLFVATQAGELICLD
jgi:hypothetical protein